jgi:hypothetical protein
MSSVFYFFIKFVQFFYQEFGGDPVTASVVTDKGALIPTRITDLGDGTYEIRDVAIFNMDK